MTIIVYVIKNDVKSVAGQTNIFLFNLWSMTKRKKNQVKASIETPLIFFNNFLKIITSWKTNENGKICIVQKNRATLSSVINEKPKE